MKAYKGFDKDLKCRGYQFREGELHIEKEANCVQNGFHCAENPLDCLSYYSNWVNSVYYIVEASGDIHEDGSDSKLSCTELLLIKKLSLKEFVDESVEYIKRYPMRKSNHYIHEEKSNNTNYKSVFTIVRGKHPMAAGEKGTILGFAKEEKDGLRIIETAVVEVDGINIKENTWYTLWNGQVIPAEEETT